MKKLMFSIAMTTSMVVTSSTVCAETKKVTLSTGLNYV
ncbi:sel1 repeat family protein, partial [Acinetobacter baumannii]